MRCGRISVEGETENIIPLSPKPTKPHQRRSHHGKKNPYSSLGLDKFASLKAELSAKRESFARKTGTPEAMVRFAYTPRGWVPVVVQNGNKVNEGGVSILPPIRAKQDNYEEEDENHEVKADEGCGNGVNGSVNSQETVHVIMPWWSEYGRTTVIGVMTLTAILVRKPAAAMAVVMVVGSLLWLGGVKCMKRFIDRWISYFSDLFLHWKWNPEIKASSLQGSLQVQQSPVASPEQKMIISKREEPLSAPCCPTMRGQAPAFSAPKSQEFITQQQQEGKKSDNDKEKLSMNGQPRRPIKMHQLERRVARREAIDASVGATLMIILLFFLLFYGKFCAICFTSAWWYVLPKVRTDSNNDSSSSDKNNSMVGVDLQSKEYKKKVIMDGLLHRNHSRAMWH